VRIRNWSLDRKIFLVEVVSCLEIGMFFLKHILSKLTLPLGSSKCWIYFFAH